MAETVHGQLVVKKKNTKSIVWERFALSATEDGKVLEKEQDRPICRLCGRGVQAKGSNTTNLYQHLREHHPLIYAETAPKLASKKGESSNSTSQMTLVDTIAKSVKYGSHSTQAKELNRAVTYYIAKDAVPISTADKPGFRLMVSKLNPRYELPSRKHFSDYEIPQLYSHVRDNVVVPTLQQAKVFAGTTDMWTSGTCDPYITFTIHFIDSNWELRSFCLDTIPLYEDHTGQNIADATTDILDNWKLTKENLVAMTTDSGANIVAAFRIVEILRISCFGHNLDLAIKKGLNINQVQRALSRCHSLVETFHRSWKKTRDLRHKQDQLDLPQHKIMGDVATRWGSTYEMVSRINEQQQAISAVLAEDRKYWCKMPTDAEFAVLETLTDVLKPLSYLTDALACEKQVTASAIFPVLKHVKSILTPIETENRLAKEMKQLMWSDLENRYTDFEVSVALSIASFLDPRFKDNHLQNKEEIIELITEQCMENYSSVHSEFTDATSSAGSQEDVVIPPAKKLKGLAAVLKHIEQEDGCPCPSNTLTLPQQLEKEIKSYLDFPAVEPDTDPLIWWKVEHGRFPDLAYLAKKYLCICGTSVASERMFSTAGYIASHTRNRLLPQNVNKLVFLARNID